MSDQGSERVPSRMTAEEYEALVRKVAEQVWRTLRHELRIARERRGARIGRAR
jgi:hypothetical protein